MHPSDLRATSITFSHRSVGRAQLAAVACAALLATACATQPAPVVTTIPLPADHPRLTVETSPGAAPVEAGAALEPPAPRALVVATADHLVGTRYRYGGTTPKRGF